MLLAAKQWVSSQEVFCVSSGSAPQQQAIKSPYDAMDGCAFSGEFNSFPWPKLSPAAECHVQSIIIPSLAIHKIGKYHRRILKSLQSQELVVLHLVLACLLSMMK